MIYFDQVSKRQRTELTSLNSLMCTEAVSNIFAKLHDTALSALACVSKEWNKYIDSSIWHRAIHSLKQREILYYGILTRWADKITKLLGECEEDCTISTEAAEAILKRVKLFQDLNIRSPNSKYILSTLLERIKTSYQSFLSVDPCKVEEKTIVENNCYYLFESKVLIERCISQPPNEITEERPYDRPFSHYVLMLILQNGIQSLYGPKAIESLDIVLNSMVWKSVAVWQSIVNELNLLDDGKNGKIILKKISEIKIEDGIIINITARIDIWKTWGTLSNVKKIDLKTLCNNTIKAFVECTKFENLLTIETRAPPPLPSDLVAYLVKLGTASLFGREAIEFPLIVRRVCKDWCIKMSLIEQLHLALLNSRNVTLKDITGIKSDSEAIAFIEAHKKDLAILSLKDLFDCFACCPWDYREILKNWPSLQTLDLDLRSFPLLGELDSTSIKFNNFKCFKLTARIHPHFYESEFPQNNSLEFSQLISRVILNCPNLETLTIDWPKDNDSINTVFGSIIQLKELKHLTLSLNELNDLSFINQLSKLETLEIECGSVILKKLTEINLPGLRKLSLVIKYFDVKEGVPIFQQLENLEELSLGIVANRIKLSEYVETRDFLPPLQGLTKLEKLHFAGGGGLRKLHPLPCNLKEFTLELGSVEEIPDLPVNLKILKLFCQHGNRSDNFEIRHLQSLEQFIVKGFIPSFSILDSLMNLKKIKKVELSCEPRNVTKEYALIKYSGHTIK